MNMSALFGFMYVHHVYAWCLQNAKEDSDPWVLELVTDGYAPS